MAFSPLEVGFAAFYLNRCNHSGILNARPIGGLSQKGTWKIDARFNKPELKKKIRIIASYRSRISFYNTDAMDFVKSEMRERANLLKKIIIYFDPPYYDKGKNLYLDYYNDDDHILLSEFIKEQKNYIWVLSYNDVPQIRKLYTEMNQKKIEVNYFAHSVRKGDEILIFSSECNIPPITI